MLALIEIFVKIGLLMCYKEKSLNPVVKTHNLFDPQPFFVRILRDSVFLKSF